MFKKRLSQLQFYAFLICSILSTAYSQDFLFKDNNGVLTKAKMDFEIDKDLAIQLKNVDLLQKFGIETKDLRQGRIQREIMSESEKLISLIFIFIFTITETSTYKLSSDTTLRSTFGFVLFFPAEIHTLTRHCQGKDFVIATTHNPKPEDFALMPTPDEIKSLCAPESPVS